MISIDPKEIPLAQLHQYLLGAVAPRPIAFASTLDSAGRPNLSPFSFFNVFSVHPPIAIFSPARRGRDNTTKHTFENAKQVKECVINIVNYGIVQQMSVASAEFPEGVNEFEKSGLTPIPSERVKPFRVKESPIHLECKINDVIELGQNGGAGNLVVCEVLLMHVAEHVLDEDGKISPMLLDQVARMGGHWYTRANKGLFELPQPNTHLGIGVDQIPFSICNSTVLTGNNLGQLASIDRLPDETSVNEFKLTELSDLFIEFEGRAKELELELHYEAKKLLEENRIHDAWMTLLAFNN